MAKFTEKWSKGRYAGTVVSDRLTDETINDGRSHNDTEYYGGYLVAESIPKNEYVDLIAAAPDLLQACKEALSDIRYVTQSHPEITGRWQRQIALDALLRAIAKAEGKEVKSNG